MCAETVATTTAIAGSCHTIAPLSEKSDAPGCRSAAITTGLVVGFALAFMAVGLAMVNNPGCSGACETAGITFLYAGLPVSGVFGFLFGDLALAWPLDLTLWVVVGFLLARLTDRRGLRPAGVAIAVVVVALIYGLVLSTFVEMAM